jgi:hypothetical protein
VSAEYLRFGEHGVPKMVSTEYTEYLIWGEYGVPNMGEHGVPKIGEHGVPKIRLERRSKDGEH